MNMNFYEFYTLIGENVASSSRYWGPYSLVTIEGDFIKVNADDLSEPLYVPRQNNVTNVGNGPINQKLTPPWVKYFEYVKQGDKNIITYAENRAVDCVPYSRSNNAVYLINRNKDPKGLAIPGGFFDNKEDGFSANNPPKPTTVAPKAAARELGEETGAAVNASGLVYVGEFDASNSDRREKNVKTWAYIYEVPDGELHNFKFGDDASQAPGSPSMIEKGLKGWYSVNEMPNLAFAHHNTILKFALSHIAGLKESLYLAGVIGEDRYYEEIQGQANTPEQNLLSYLESNKAQIKHYKKFAKVKAMQSRGGEQVQTQINGRNETDVRTTNPGDWVVSNLESQGEQQIVDDVTFKKRYDVANPKGDVYSPKGANFYGLVYPGEPMSFSPPNWGGSKQNILKGYMVGGPDPNQFSKDFYGIDPDAFTKTYRPANQVAD